LNGVVFELNGDCFTIGREPDNTLRLDHTSVSKYHAMLKVDNDGDFELFDLHSTNGVIVNGVARVASHLRNGDRIVLGEVALRFLADKKDATQLLALMPPPMSRPSPVQTAKPVVARVDPKPVLARQPPPNRVPEHQDGAADPRKPRGKFAALMSAFRRKPTQEEPAPAKPPSREEIHAGLSTTFSKIGLEMPKPPPPSSRPKI
jgi:pSer/pThr/pTyr-binding forkhead associated (FHA) protein